MSDGKNGFSDFTEFDFKPIGMAIKKARESQGITREQLSEKIDYAPRHIQARLVRLPKRSGPHWGVSADCTFRP